MLPSNTANSFTRYSITDHSNKDVQFEIDLVERNILNAANRESFYLLYNAQRIKNPDSLDVLTPDQSLFLNELLSRGYRVDIDDRTKYWKIEWYETKAILDNIATYHIKTTVTLGAIQSNMVNVINTRLNQITPKIYTKVIFLNDNNVLVLCDQQFVNNDYSNDIMIALTTSPLLFDNTNTIVNKH